jgi:hypothetical protein
MESASLAGSFIDIIPISQWKGYTDKILMMKQVLEFIPDDDLVGFVDAYDVLCFADSLEIITKFFDYKCDILVSSELNCYPRENEVQYQNLPAFNSISTQYRYVNSGGYIGYCYALKRMFGWKSPEEIEEICRLGGDQNYFTQYYLTHANHIGTRQHAHIRIDDKQKIWQSLYKVNLRTFVFLEGRLYNHVLQSYPCFAHFNGFFQYNHCMMNRYSNEPEPAMEVFIRKIHESRYHGNALLDYYLPCIQ